MYLPFTDLNVGFTNAENYQRRENHELLTKYFVRDAFLEDLLNPNVFYLVGEKGTGKTAYATFLQNTDYKGNRAVIYDVRQTEYQKFLEMKKQGHLPLSQYSEVWRTLLLMAAATSILGDSNTPELLRRFTKLNGLKKAIDEFYDSAFAPEIVKMINFVESGELAASLLAKHMGLTGKLSAKRSDEIRDSESVFQTHLLRIRQGFENALSALKLDHNILVFIDGIDVRPGDISYADYFDCIRGLIEGVWALNNGFLSNIKDSPGRIRVVLLVRPDTFLRTGLHNLNTKLRDNSVFLNWITTYKDYRGSLLFRVADQLLSAQQSSPPAKLGDAWDHYFPFFAENVTARSVSDRTGVNSFLAFLRFSYYRPRDIASMIGTMKDLIRKKRETAGYATAEDFNDSSFRDAHAEYLLGEIRDQLLFYYSQDEYDSFLQFFTHLHGKRRFSYDDFIEAFNQFVTESSHTGRALPQFFESAHVFLQFLYELNVICFKEREDEDGAVSREPFIRWCFRERTLSNMSPKIRIGVEYEIFYGLSKALNLGRRILVRRPAPQRQIGTIISINTEKGFGFIRGGALQSEYYFKLVEYAAPSGLPPRITQKVTFEVNVKYAKPRAIGVAPTR